MAAFRVTYATLSADNEELHAAYEEGVRTARACLGQAIPTVVDGEARSDGEPFTLGSPNDDKLELATVHAAGERDVDDTVTAARAAFPAWAATPWVERVALLRRAADLISERSNELAALMTMEVGKNRLEALGDVEESADLIRYYCQQLEDNDGFARRIGQLSENEHTRSVLKPYGVWAVISPFNFPLALAAGPAGGALAAGNTVVSNPASDTPLLGAKLTDVVVEAKLPPGVFNFVTGPGSTVGQELIDNDGIDGIVFTGSKEVGLKLIRDNAARAVPRPLIIEMGGKNPAIITGSADIDKASDGVMRSAFGAQGQKCSACSRVYIQKQVRDTFVQQLVEKTKRIKVGNPLERDVWMGPVINDAAVRTYLSAIERAKKDGGRILVGGKRITQPPFDRGYFVEPTVIDG